eukprot:4587995-Prymnesium_polylepis.1
MQRRGLPSRPLSNSPPTVLMVLTSPRQLTHLERGIEGYLDQSKEPMSPDSGFTVRLKRWVGNSVPRGRS